MPPQSMESMISTDSRIPGQCKIRPVCFSYLTCSNFLYSQLSKDSTSAYMDDPTSNLALTFGPHAPPITIVLLVRLKIVQLYCPRILLNQAPCLPTFAMSLPTNNTSLDCMVLPQLDHVRYP